MGNILLSQTMKAIILLLSVVALVSSQAMIPTCCQKEGNSYVPAISCKRNVRELQAVQTYYCVYKLGGRRMQAIQPQVCQNARRVRMIRRLQAVQTLCPTKVFANATYQCFKTQSQC